VAAVADAAGPRRQRLRIAAAALLQKRGDRREALAMLQGEGEALAEARRLVEARRQIPGALDDPGAGIGEFLARLAIDLNVQEARPLAIALIRIASFMAPDNAEAWQIVAELLSADGRHDAAIAAVDRIGPNDPFHPAARDMRVRLLLQAGRRDEAVAAAQALAAAPTAGVMDWTRVGDVLTEMKRYPEAAQAYGRAIAMVQGTDGLWQLLLVQGGAFERGGDWPAAKAALERAHQLAPGEPLVLNYLGYAQLARRENIEAATAMVAEAHRLAPDSAAITDSLGWAHYMNGDLASALPLLEQAAQAEPADVEINEHLGDAYHHGGRRTAARFAWRAALVYAEGEDAARLNAKIANGLTPQLAAR
jgi:tetratricopeptide (TPR) repeat protein